jgi:uncharacterized protein DUF3618
MTEREGFPRDAEETRLDLELTRQELGETTQALADKVKDTVHTTERLALTAMLGVGLGVLLVLLIRRLMNGGDRQWRARRKSTADCGTSFTGW